MRSAYRFGWQGGRNVVRIEGISDSVDAQSPRIHGLGEGVRVFDLTCDVGIAQAPHGRNSKNARERRRLEDEREELDVKRKLYQQEASLLDVAAATAVQDPSHAGVDRMNELLQRRGEAIRAVSAIGKQIAELDREIWLLERSYVGRSEVVLVVTIISERDCSVNFQLTYRACVSFRLRINEFIAVTCSG